MWFSESKNNSPDGKYFHYHLVEDQGEWDAARDSMVAYFRGAHEDSIRRFQRLMNGTLHPANAHYASPYDQYPWGLPKTTVQGYFGEIMAGWIAENYGASGEGDWEVPAYLFRYHMPAFHFLESNTQTSESAKAVFGRIGDDCVAFKRGQDGLIRSVLFCEAKCTSTHDASMIREAHEKAANGALVDILQVIEVLTDSTRRDAEEWIIALRELHLRLHDNVAAVDRHDLVCYVHSQAPVRSDTWIPINCYHAAYTAKRILNAFEVRLDDVDSRVDAVYCREVWS